MLQEKTTYKTSELPAFVQNTLTEDLLLVDLETTGLSPARDRICCIGCGYRNGEEICVLLLFAQRGEEEEEILNAFFSLAKSYAGLITFNGTTFDLPFIEKRAALVCGEAKLPTEHIDLYREAKAQRRLLQLPSYRQKDLECFLGCAREDERRGGDLIDLYLRYTTTQDQEALRLILLHNRDDVRGMFDLLSLLAYRQFADGAFAVAKIQEESLPVEAGEDASCRGGDAQTEPTRFLEVTLVPRDPLPQSIHLSEEAFSLLLDHERALMRLPIRHGTLKHFFANYREYYYLPAEDTAVHESVGALVDPAHRKRATRQTCYVRRECDYVSLPIREKRPATGAAGTGTEPEAGDAGTEPEAGDAPAAAGGAEGGDAPAAGGAGPAAGPGALRQDYADTRMYLELPASAEALRDLIMAWFAQTV